MTRTLPERPDLDQLRRQAKELLESFQDGDAAATAEIRAHYRGAKPETFALHEAQLVLARAYGFPSWPKLKAHVDGVTVARLVDAVRAGDIEAARAMLKVRPELATMDLGEHDEHQALHFAVLARNEEMVRLLMRHGANARKGIYPHRDASSAYTIAIERGFTAIAGVIEEEEAKSGHPRPYGDAALQKPIPPELAEASRRGDQDALIAFLEAHPEMQHHVEYLLTPLHRASMHLWDRVALWLLDHGADVNARIDGGPSPLELAGFHHLAHRAGDAGRAMADLLRSRGAEMTPRAAVALGDLDAIRRLHDAGALINSLPRNQGPRGLLSIAVAMNRIESLRLLLDLGFDPDEPVTLENGETARCVPLNAAIHAGRLDFAEELVARGAALSPSAAILLGKADWLRAHFADGIGGEEHLIYGAVKCGRAEIVEVLLDLGCDPTDGGEPLLECIRQRNHALAEILLRRGADPNRPSGTAMFNALRERDTAMLEVLRRHGARTTPETPCYLRDLDGARAMLAEDASEKRAEEMLDGAATGGSPEILAMVLERIRWPRDDSRWYGKMRSAMVMWHEIPWIRREDWKLDRSTYLECLRLLLTRADPNVRHKFGITPLHEAASLGDWITGEEVVSFARLLLDAGALTDVRDEMLRSTPLGWACRWGRAGLVKVLLDCGADPVEQDAEPWATPMAWAHKMGHTQIEDLLKVR